MDKFLSNANPVSWFANRALSIFQTDFHADHYSDALIAHVNDGYGTFIQNAVVKRKSEFIAGRYCAHRSLTSWNIPDGIISIGEGRSPVWPAGIVGSISHCHACAVAVTARADDLFAIGLDVEDIVAEETRNNIQNAVVNQNEMVLLAQSPRPDVVFTLIFSLKESFFKAAYPHVKFYFDFPAISLTHIDWEQGRVLFELNQQLGTLFAARTAFSGQFRILENKRVVTLFQIANQKAYSKATA
jgi:4'-phosphopantetheinyl transferase EntD